MRYLPTPDQLVERLRKKAKKLQRAGGGKYNDLLNRVAKSEGYDHWHHVVLCNDRSKGSDCLLTLRQEFENISQAELRGEIKVVLTGPELEIGPFVLFSTGIGDAWAIDPDQDYAMCLVWRSQKLEPLMRDDSKTLEIHWHGEFELLGDFFKVVTIHPEIGERAIAGYPVEEIRRAVSGAQATWRKMAAVIGQVDAVDLTSDVISQMVRKGWDEKGLLKMQAEGFRYSPGRNSLLGPVMTNEDFEDDEFDDDGLDLTDMKT